MTSRVFAVQSPTCDVLCYEIRGEFTLWLHGLNSPDVPTRGPIMTDGGVEMAEILAAAKARGHRVPVSLLDELRAL